MSPFDSRGFGIGRGPALLSRQPSLAACAVYDDSLLKPPWPWWGQCHARRIQRCERERRLRRRPRCREWREGRGEQRFARGVDSVDAAAGVGGGGQAGDPVGTGGAVEHERRRCDPRCRRGRRWEPRNQRFRQRRAAFTEELIDDMEDGNAFIPAVDGRRGTWSVANDGTVGSDQVPSNPFFMTLIPNGRGKEHVRGALRGTTDLPGGRGDARHVEPAEQRSEKVVRCERLRRPHLLGEVGYGRGHELQDPDRQRRHVAGGQSVLGHDVQRSPRDRGDVVDDMDQVHVPLRRHASGRLGRPQKPFDTTRNLRCRVPNVGQRPVRFWIDDLAFLKK